MELIFLNLIICLSEQIIGQETENGCSQLFVNFFSKVLNVLITARRLSPLQNKQTFLHRLVQKNRFRITLVSKNQVLDSFSGAF